ncbi:MAG: hypothetical protein ACERNK_20265 [Deltaproteobacteria bacterium]
MSNHRCTPFPTALNAAGPPIGLVDKVVDRQEARVGVSNKIEDDMCQGIATAGR